LSPNVRERVDCDIVAQYHIFRSENGHRVKHFDVAAAGLEFGDQVLMLSFIQNTEQPSRKSDGNWTQKSIHRSVRRLALSLFFS
jgi:hypothetical protein